MNLDRLETVSQLVNTLDPDTGSDDLDTPTALVEWLAQRGLAPPGTVASGGDLTRARTLRAALCELLFANAGGMALPGATETLDRQARRSLVTLAFEKEGATLEPRATGVDAALGRILSVVAAAMADGSWPRLKACRADDCRWAFVDRTRNGSRHWCDMRVCGNRQKARAFRARHAR